MLLIPAAANAGWAVAFLILAGSFLRRSMALAGALAMEMLSSKGMIRRQPINASGAIS